MGQRKLVLSADANSAHFLNGVHRYRWLAAHLVHYTLVIGRWPIEIPNDARGRDGGDDHAQRDTEKPSQHFGLKRKKISGGISA